MYVASTILFTVYSQLILKWQMGLAGELPKPLSQKLVFLLMRLKSPWVWSAFGAALMAALFWMAALTTFELSRAYPFMSLSFVLILVLSSVFLGEPVTISKMIGIAMIVVGAMVIGVGS